MGLTAASSAIDAVVQKKVYGSGTTLVISNEEMDDIMKIVQALEDSNILFKVVIKTIKNETKEQKGGFLSMLLGTLGASLPGDLLTKNLSASRGRKYKRRKRNLKKALMPGNFSLKNSPHPLTNFEIKNYFQNEPRFNGVYSRDNLPKTVKKEHM